MNKIRNHIATFLMIFVLGLGFSNLAFAGDARTGGTASANASSTLFRVNSNTTNLHRIYFHRGDMVDISLYGDGATDLDLYVYDEYGRLCARSNGVYDEENISLDVYQSGYFTIKVVNQGWDYNDYDLSVEVY
jgi:hypothetical protein